MSNSQEDIYISPSFSSYSSNQLAEVAGRVATEKSTAASGGEVDDDDGDDGDFEFALVREDQEVSVVDFFPDGQIRHVFPVFNRDLLLDSGGDSSACGERDLLESTVAIPLSKLFIEEDRERAADYPPSCSSSEADELDSVPTGTYCVWRPKLAESPMPSQCKKSKSTGFASSRRWKLRDLMRRSKSDGKDSFVFLTPKHRDEKLSKSIDATNKAEGKLGLRSASGGRPAGSLSAHEAFYVRNKAMKEGEKKKSYLPYRRELVGFFANVNGLSKSNLTQF